jgi:NADH-quinone oxidoreductase subunit F
LVSSILESFPDDVAAHLDRGCLSDRTQIPTPKILELADGVVTYDQRQERKQPDWTYA